ncbi:dihydrolipoyl dehydrogenase [Geoalkalibacter sp.]|uniref:dihydrolipoyl dehydrogenase n=1 Tax=Geoalkalibacter sp. TaxID=3041440 RepID=UPI00272E96B8|nr:dihydrolipoyl dehydrogenase [Geoalkalibacter sp.]
MAKAEFDIIVLGAGPGGYVGAIRAAQLGFRTALIEANHLGGVCLNWGCIPTKAMLRSAEIYRQFKHAESYGLSSSQVEFDLQKIVARSRNIAKQLSSGVAHLLKKNKVTVFDGYGRLLGGGKLSVEKNGREPLFLSGKHILLATGSRPRISPGLEPDGNLVWTSKEALVPKSLPPSLLVIGSGAIGIEFASFYNAFGSKVTVVEIMDQILPTEDREIAEFAQKEMEKQGIRFLLGTKVGNLRRDEGTVEATCEKAGKSESITVSRVISAVGVVPNVEDIGLEAAGVLLDARGFIQTNAHGRTTAEGIFAIGDVSGGPCLAHKASHEAILCVETIAGLQGVHALDKTLIPSCTYSHPQVASVGLTEVMAKEAGNQINVGRFPARGNGKAIAMGEPEGLVKTIFDARTGELLGAHLVGAEVTELIQGFAIAKNLETTEVDLIRTIFPHPTLSEMIHESVLGACGRAIHV